MPATPTPPTRPSSRKLLPRSLSTCVGKEVTNWKRSGTSTADSPRKGAVAAQSATSCNGAPPPKRASSRWPDGIRTPMRTGSPSAKDLQVIAEATPGG